MKVTLLPFENILSVKSRDFVFVLKRSLGFKNKQLKNEVKEYIIDGSCYVECYVENLCKDIKIIKDSELHLPDGVYSYLNDNVRVSVYKKLNTGEYVKEFFEVSYKDFVYRKGNQRGHQLTNDLLKPYFEAKSSYLEYFKYTFINELSFTDNFPIGKSIDLFFDSEYFKSRYVPDELKENITKDLLIKSELKESFYLNDRLYLRLVVDSQSENSELFNLYKNVFYLNEEHNSNFNDYQLKLFTNDNEIVIPYYSNLIKENNKFILQHSYSPFNRKYFENREVMLKELSSLFVKRVSDYGIFVYDKLLSPSFKYNAIIDNDDEQRIIIRSLYTSSGFPYTLKFHRPVFYITVNEGDKSYMDQLVKDINNLLYQVN